MQSLPHDYSVTAISAISTDVRLYSDATTAIVADSPPEFGGPEKLWSPETILVGSIASCYALTFRGLAIKSKLKWDQLHTEVHGKLEKVERQLQFTEFTIKARLDLPADQDKDAAESLLYRAEELCLITNSLNANVNIKAEVSVKELA